MKEFNNYLKSENLIQKLLKYYKVSEFKDGERSYFERLINKFYESDDSRISANDSNFNALGKFYEKSLLQVKRKEFGEFYTPKPIVKYILNAVGYNKNQNIQKEKLADLSCGSGSFIILAIQILVKSCLKSFKRRDLSDISIQEVKYIISTIKKNIIGIDLNPFACVLCQININFELFELIKIIRNLDENYSVPLFNIINSNAFSINESNVYDYVVGNPPYLFIRDIPNDQRTLIKNSNLKTKNGQYDYYQIFIEIGIKLLKNKGMLGYIVPDSLLALSNRSILRKYIYNTTKIREINSIGPQFEDPIVSNIIIILEKESFAKEREDNYIKVKNQNLDQIDVRQEKIKDWDYKFLIHLNDEDLYIINYLSQRFLKLKELIADKNYEIKISRGIELTKKGEIIYCMGCKKYFPIPKKVLICPECKNPLNAEYIEKIVYDSIPNENNENYKLFISSINRYQIGDYKFIRIDKKGINYKDLETYQDRVIIRQLNQNNLICATYDKNLSLTSQSFYNLRINVSPIKEFNNIYLLGIVNSKLISYYFIKLFGSYKKLFPRILIEKIKEFPIKVPENNREKEIASNIIKKVEILLMLNRSDDDRYETLQNEIDNLVFELYNIPDSYQSYISEVIRKA